MMVSDHVCTFLIMYPNILLAKHIILNLPLSVLLTMSATCTKQTVLVIFAVSFFVELLTVPA